MSFEEQYEKGGYEWRTKNSGNKKNAKKKLNYKSIDL